MKKLVIYLVFTLSQVAIAQYEDCKGDLICYYETNNRIEVEKRQQQEQELGDYRTQQLQLQKQQVEEIQLQNNLLEEQLLQMERQEEIANQQLKEQQKLNLERKEAQPPPNNLKN